MATGLIWKQGDLQPDERVQLTERDPDVTPTSVNPTPRRGIDLSNATSVELVARSRDRTRTVTVSCTPDGGQGDDSDPQAGRGWITVTPSVDLTSFKAQFMGEFLITWSSGDPQRVPNQGWITVEIEEGLS